MRINIPEHIKSAIIDAWMMGKTRDKIASEFIISSGSVSNIIEHKIQKRREQHQQQQ